MRDGATRGGDEIGVGFKFSSYETHIKARDIVVFMYTLSSELAVCER